MATWTLLPALLAFQSNDTLPSPMMRLPFSQSKSLALFVTAAALGSLIRGIPSFDVDYTGLQPRDSETVRWERVMTEETPFSIQFAGFVARDSKRERMLVRQVEAIRGVGAVMALSELGSESWPSWLVDMFRSEGGQSAVLVFADSDLWDAATRKDFVRELRLIDTQVTGMPILSEFMLEKTRAAFATQFSLDLAGRYRWLSPSPVRMPDSLWPP